MDALRSTPALFLQKQGLVIDQGRMFGVPVAPPGQTSFPLEGGIPVQEGGQCELTYRETKGNVAFVDVKAGTRDYFFPYVQNGIGRVDVPKDAPVGTLVVTGGMNGCGFDVRENGVNTLRFQHDANSCRVANHAQSKALTGVKYLGYADYAPKGKAKDTADAFADMKKAEGKIPASYFLYTVFAVKQSDGWGVYTIATVHDGSEYFRVQDAAPHLGML